MIEGTRVRKSSSGVEITGQYNDKMGQSRPVPCSLCGSLPRHYVKSRPMDKEHLLLCLGCGREVRQVGRDINDVVRSWNDRNQFHREQRCGNCLNYGFGSAYPKRLGRHKLCSWCNCTIEDGDGYGCRGFSPKIKQL